MSSNHSIGTLREQHLHASLKQWLTEPGDIIEQKVDSYFIDIVRGDLLIEIQTGSFLKLKKKLTKLLDKHKVLLVHPVAATKWIVRKTKRGRKLSRRKSPKRGRIEDIFSELLYIPDIAQHRNFRLQVLLIEQEDIWRDDGKGSWRRKHWSVADKILLDVVGSADFRQLDDYLNLIPANLETPFTNKQLADALKAPTWVSRRMSYCLRKMGALEVLGKSGRSMLLSPTKATDKIVAV